MVQTRAARRALVPKADDFFPRKFPNEVILLIANDDNLAKADLKSLRLTCKTLHALATPVLFRTAICSSLWTDRRKFIHIGKAPHLASCVRKLLWLELTPPLTRDNPDPLELDDDDYCALRADIDTKLRGGTLFWIKPHPLGIDPNGPIRARFMPSFVAAMATMPNMETVEVSPMPDDRVIWTNRRGWGFTAGHVRSLHDDNVQRAGISDGGGAHFGAAALRVLQETSEVEPVFIWTEGELPACDTLALELMGDEGEEHALQRVRGLSLCLVNAREEQGPPPLGLAAWDRETMEPQLRWLSAELFRASNLQTLCLDWSRWAFRDDSDYKPLSFLWSSGGEESGSEENTISDTLETVIIKCYDQERDFAVSLERILVGHGGSIRTLRLEDCKMSVQAMRALVQERIPRVENLVVIEDGLLVYKGESKGAPKFFGGVDLPFGIPKADNFPVRDPICTDSRENGCNLLHHIVDTSPDGQDQEEGVEAVEGGEDGAAGETKPITILSGYTKDGALGSWDTQAGDGPAADNDSDIEMEDVGDQDHEDGSDSDSDSESYTDDPADRYRKAPYWAYRPYSSTTFHGAIYWPVPKDHPFAHPTTIFRLSRNDGQGDVVYTWLEPDEIFEDWDETKGDRVQPTPFDWELGVLACSTKPGREPEVVGYLGVFEGGIRPFPRKNDPDDPWKRVNLDEGTRGNPFMLPDYPEDGGYFGDDRILNHFSPEHYVKAIKERAQWELDGNGQKTPWYEEVHQDEDDI